MGDAILERGQQQQQLKDVARVAVLGLTRTRRREREGERKKPEGVSRRRGDKKLGQVRQVTAPAVPGGFSVLAAFCYFRFVDEINTRRVIFLLLL